MTQLSSADLAPTRSRRLRTVATGVGLAIGVVFWMGSNRVPAVGTDILTLDTQPPLSVLSGPRFRVGSFNIHGGKDRSGNCDLCRTASSLRKPQLDVIGLSEVHGYAWGHPRDQAGMLGQQLEMASLFAPTERRYWHDSFGNGLLTSVRLDAIHRVPLPGTQGYKYRNAVLTNFRVDKTEVHFLTVHIDRVCDREKQLKQVFDLFLSLEEPAILVGDLNTMADDPQLADLLARPDVHDAVTEGLGKPVPRRIDWILTRGLKTVTADCTDDGSSDHPLVWAELELVPPASESN